MTTVLHKGQNFPVNAHWHEANTAKWPDLAARSRAELDRMLDAFVRKSNSDEGHTDEELERAYAANAHYNVRGQLDILGGRSHTDFGYTGVDQLHFQTLKVACGCVLTYVHDHHKRGQPDNVTQLHTPRRVCDRHAEHAHDLAALHEHVRIDDLAREQAEQAARGE